MEPVVKTVGKVLGIEGAPPPPPTPAAVTKNETPPDVAAAADRARQAREQADAVGRKRGRRSTVQTGPEGVGATPVGVKTLVGS